jgi:hypothetical protein
VALGVKGPRSVVDIALIPDDSRLIHSISPT